MFQCDPPPPKKNNFLQSDAMRDAKMDDISPEQQQLDPEVNLMVKVYTTKLITYS